MEQGTELMLLPYFDCVLFHIIDPMHNLFMGTAKHIMKNVWLDSEKPLLEKKDLENIQEKMDKLKVPASVGRMPKKIKNSYGGFTADQWKTFTTLFSIYAMWNILPSSDLELWQDFVMACSCLCSPVITETKALLAHSYLLKFFQSFEQIYGKHRVTPNIHRSTFPSCRLSWIMDRFIHFGCLVLSSIMAFLVIMEQINALLMCKFTSSQYVNDLPLPVSFQTIFKPLSTDLTQNYLEVRVNLEGFMISRYQMKTTCLKTLSSVVFCPQDS